VCVFISGSAPRIILASGCLIGEGFDHLPLDTMVPRHADFLERNITAICWAPAQVHDIKQDVRIYDYIEHKQPDYYKT
jgi:hypothetical protein